MIDAELLRSRQAAEAALTDAKVLYRFRVAALLGGERIRCAPGDRVRIGEDEGRVLRVEETPAEPERLYVRFFADDSIKQVEAHELKVLAPHRPAVLLGEDELKRRLEDEAQDSAEPRGLETLIEVARRRLRGGIELAVSLFDQIEAARDDGLRKALTTIIRSHPFGELEVALRHLGTHPLDEDLVELAPLAAGATESEHAKDILDRLEAMGDRAQAVRVVRRAGRALVGAGGPAFLSADVRERVSTLTREHASKELRVALFVHAATGLQSEDLLEKALGSDSPTVRSAAARELLRRGKSEPVDGFLRAEEDHTSLESVVAQYKEPLPLDVVERLLGLAKKGAALEELTLLRLAESVDDGAVALLAPWLDKGRKSGAAAAVWTAGMLGDAEAGGKILALIAKRKLEGTALPHAIESLARLSHEQAAQAFDAWGAPALGLGTWGHEWADAVGLLLGRSVDAHELLGRILVAGPAGPVRRVRALDAAMHLSKNGNGTAARGARVYLPTPYARFNALAEALT